MRRDLEKAEVDPALADGLYYGPSAGTCRGSTRRSSGCRAGTATARRWACGSSTTSPTGRASGRSITHTKIQYRAPALTGEVTFLDGTVSDVSDDPTDPESKVATVDVEMKTHTGQTMAKGPVRVRFPRG